MTSLRGHDVIWGTLNLVYYTCQSIIFQTWGRKLPYLISCGSYVAKWYTFGGRFSRENSLACGTRSVSINFIIFCTFHNFLHIYSEIPKLGKLQKSIRHVTYSDHLIAIVVFSSRIFWITILDRKWLKYCQKMSDHIWT